MSTKLRDIKLLEHCTSSIAYDAQVQAGCTAFDAQMYEIADDMDGVNPPTQGDQLELPPPQGIIFIPLILSLLDETLIDILAWQFHVDFYDPAKPLDFKRQLVQNAIQWHMRKGTVALVQEVLDTYWPGGASLTEWFEYYVPLPPNYPIDNSDVLVGSFAPAAVNISTDTITLNAHGLTNGTQIHFEQTFGVASVLPAPLHTGVLYRVITATANTFQLTSQLGGAIINLTTTGSGNNLVYKKVAGGSWHDRYRFRVIIDEQIILPEDEKQVLDLINAYKPVSRWLEGIFRTQSADCAIGWYGACLQFLYIMSEPPDYNPDEPYIEPQNT